MKQGCIETVMIIDVRMIIDLVFIDVKMRESVFKDPVGARTVIKIHGRRSE